MTIRELYEWAKKNNCVDYDVAVQYRDDGGYYDGTENVQEEFIKIDSDANGHGTVIV